MYRKKKEELRRDLVSPRAAGWHIHKKSLLHPRFSFHRITIIARARVAEVISPGILIFIFTRAALCSRARDRYGVRACIICARPVMEKLACEDCAMPA